MINVFKLQAQQVISLYNGKIPNSKVDPSYKETADTSKDGSIRISKITNPELLAFYPEKSNANGGAIIIFPGGGYRLVSMTNEGYDIAKAFNKLGYAAFIVKYRLPSDLIMEDKTIGPLQDAQQAIKIVRENAESWQINPSKIGIIGFSAGGHLASTLGTHFTKAVIANPNNTSLRPDFMILGYPVVSMGTYAHKGSKANLLGENSTDDLVKLYSNELQVDSNTPPTFIFHANDDKTVHAENSIDLARALKQAGIKSELHLYQAGGHGFGLYNKTTKENWFDSLANWLSNLP